MQMWLDKFSARVFSWNREGQYLLFYLLTVCCFMFPIEYLHIGLKYSTIFDLRILLPQGKPVGDTLSAFAPTVGDAFLLSFLRTGGGSCLFRFSCSTFFVLSRLYMLVSMRILCHIRRSFS